MNITEITVFNNLKYEYYGKTIFNDLTYEYCGNKGI